MWTLVLTNNSMHAQTYVNDHTTIQVSHIWSLHQKTQRIHPFLNIKLKRKTFKSMFSPE